MTPKIAIATCAEYPSLTDDDAPILAGLAARDLEAVPVLWDADVAWTDFTAVILRSTWDDNVRLDAFLA